MSIDSTLPSPSSLSSPSMGFDGLPGRRRKKRTSIETNVRVALERAFMTVRSLRRFGIVFGCVMGERRTINILPVSSSVAEMDLLKTKAVLRLGEGYVNVKM